MKVFVEKYESVINCWLKPQIENAKQGDVIPHEKVVTNVYFYKREIINEKEVYLKVELSKEMIVDLFNKIKVLESQVGEMPFENLPF